MSKTNQSLSNCVKKLLKASGVKVMTYEEILSKVNFSDEVKENVLQEMALKKAIHFNDLNMIGVDDNALSSTEDTHELVLHELIHMTAQKLNRVYEGEAGEQTEECVAQVGMFKLTLVLDLNPAPYADKTFEYIKEFPKANFKKVERDSDKAVEYLVKSIGMEKVA